MDARNELIARLHQRSLEAARGYFLAEAELLEALKAMDSEKAYLDLGHASLFAYAVDGLRLTESVALNFIGVARKSVLVPRLQEEIATGNLSVTKARKIASVLTPGNQDEWIGKAKSLSSRALEKEVARVCPQEAQPERVRYIAEDRVGISLSLDEKTFEILKRVQDLECQRLRRAISLEEAIAAMGAAYLERNDPLERAKRAEARAEKRKKPEDGASRSDVTGHTGSMPSPPSRTGRRALPAAREHEVRLRDGERCAHLKPDGTRCASRRWLDVHHVVEVSMGGTDELENLVTLCSAHHRMRHRKGARVGAAQRSSTPQ